MFSGRVLIGLAVAVTIVAVVLGTVFALQRKLIYLPSGGPVPNAADVLPGGRDVTLVTGAGLRLTAWYFPAAAARATVLVAPGNAGNRSLRVPLARALRERGLSVLLLDYRGYGGNYGKPTESGLARDVRAAREFLVRDQGVPPERLVYFGESLGSAVVAELAAEHPPAGLVLRSPFVDLASVGQRHYPFLPVRLLLLDKFPAAAHLRRVRAPVTVVYGTSDSIVPRHRAARSPKRRAAGRSRCPAPVTTIRRCWTARCWSTRSPKRPGDPPIPARGIRTRCEVFRVAAGPSPPRSTSSPGSAGPAYCIQR